MQLARHRIGAEAPHVAPPQHEVAELRAEGRVERRVSWLMSASSMAWKNVPLTEPRRAAAFGHGRAGGIAAIDQRLVADRQRAGIVELVAHDLGSRPRPARTSTSRRARR